MTHRHLLLPFLLLLSLLSCRDDFVLEGEAAELPVAYAFLDPGLEDNYVRVQRSFLQAGGNAEELARDAATIYYDDSEATVVLIDQRDDSEFPLERVNATNLGIEREDGIFATDPNVLYRTTGGVVPGRDVRLEIRRPDAETAVAETTILRPISITRPDQMARIDDPRSPLVVRWNIGDNAALFDLRLVYNIREINTATNTTETIRLEQPVASAIRLNERTDGLVIYEVDTETIYQFIGDRLEPKDNVVRRFDSFTVEVAAAGREALDQLLLAGANTGITSSQALPRYSNLTNGIGLVTSRVTARKEGVAIDASSQDSLRNGQYTRTLNFQ